MFLHHTPALSRRRRTPRGFTLVELLVVIVILAILSSMVLLAIGNTQASARAARTQTTIAKLDALIMAKWETYQTRRVPLKPTGTSRTNNAKQRVDAIRVMMKLELPDRITDIDNSATISPLSTRPSVSVAYKKRLDTTSNVTGNESAEALYMIVAHGLNDPDALSQFNEADIGDTDGDKLPEFLDGWGKPIGFFRWAPGYNSPIQIKDPVKNHDPFDPLNQYPEGFALYPLIYSAGPDKEYGLERLRPNPNNPYEMTCGSSTGNESLDNITNHEILAN